ncbi:DUF58 domain-containing protein [Alkalihalobacillus sp. 1P02AB]|uniref:DUF58 domain-containing protein n=1 Tax=Alkalihalobacillus sp. 1P02AB TaxID=3132260 RepID=UPI0039A60BE6
MAVAALVTITALLVFIQMSCYQKWALNDVEYERYMNDRAVFAGEKTEMTEIIVNRKLLPLPWIRLESRMDKSLRFKSQENLSIVGEAYHRSLFTLAPYQKVKRRHLIECTKRGYYPLKSVTMTSGDLFGFVQPFETRKVECEMLVYPKLLTIKELPLPSKSWQGDTIVRRWIQEDPFVNAGVRPYGPNDTLKSVNWNASVRTGDLQVNKKDYTADYHLMIYINFDQNYQNWSREQYEDLMEMAISYAATMATYTIKNGIETGFGCNSYTLDTEQKITNFKQPIRMTPKASKAQLHAIYEKLAKLHVTKSISFVQFLQQDIETRQSGRDIFIITEMVDVEMKKQIEKLKRLGNSVEIIWLKDVGNKKQA